MADLPISDELKSLFQRVTSSKDGSEARAILVQNNGGTLALIKSLPQTSDSDKEDFQDLLAKLLGEEPARSGYVLFRLNSQAANGDWEWLCAAYQPENAKIREKMQYAITRTSLLKGLREQNFLDTVFGSMPTDFAFPTRLRNARKHDYQNPQRKADEPGRSQPSIRHFGATPVAQKASASVSERASVAPAAALEAPPAFARSEQPQNEPEAATSLEQPSSEPVPAPSADNIGSSVTEEVKPAQADDQVAADLVAPMEQATIEESAPPAAPEVALSAVAADVDAEAANAPDAHEHETEAATDAPIVEHEPEASTEPTLEKSTQELKLDDAALARETEPEAISAVEDAAPAPVDPEVAPAAPSLETRVSDEAAPSELPHVVAETEVAESAVPEPVLVLSEGTASVPKGAEPPSAPAPSQTRIGVGTGSSSLLTERETSLEEIKRVQAAERASSGTNGGTHGRGIGFRWDDGVEEAVRGLRSTASGSAEWNSCILCIDIKAEVIQLAKPPGFMPLGEIASALDIDEPRFLFYRYEDESAPGRTAVVVIYSCPGASGVRERMVYTSNLQIMLNHSNGTLGLPIAKKIETSDPAELTAAYLASEWGSLLHGGQGKQSTDVEDKPGFAKPRRPGKR